jgi:hypothetical protein
MWEQNRGQEEGKHEKMILESKSSFHLQHIGIGLPNCDANQRGTIKCKARKQQFAAKQTNKRGGRKT